MKGRKKNTNNLEKCNREIAFPTIVMTNGKHNLPAHFCDLGASTSVSERKSACVCVCFGVERCIRAARLLGKSRCFYVVGKTTNTRILRLIVRCKQTTMNNAVRKTMVMHYTTLHLNFVKSSGGRKQTRIQIETE